jgi:serine/threonine-protein kinase
MIWPFGRRERFRGYNVLRLIYEGDKSHVFLAEASRGGASRVAIKLYTRAYDRTARAIEKEHGIPSEAEVGRKLNPRVPAEAEDHPIVITISDGRELGKIGAPRYIVLEFVEGVTLKRLITCRDERVWKRRVALLAQCCRALQVVHDAGFICRDFVPQNLIVQGDGKIKLLDLGFVAPAGMAFPERSGTPSYMSPEQIDAQELTPATDIYSVGIMLYEMLTGRLPYVSDIAGEDPESEEKRRREVMKMHLEQPEPTFPDAVRRRSERLCTVAERCMRKDPSVRYQSVPALLAALKGQKPAPEEPAEEGEDEAADA